MEKIKDNLREDTVEMVFRGPPHSSPADSRTHHTISELNKDKEVIATHHLAALAGRGAVRANRSTANYMALRLDSEVRRALSFQSATAFPGLIFQRISARCRT
ncbi:hypothetical protein EJ03DRAFT_14658 [Teratosphaeria nubilosa]|uniref:Uncharacterized protein n=1 Tax=Teratosphaeria nubilosa TaxID=161662 RepID=A0A6G1KW09_9PEZI|nr:hypothetical protein EJ03DRAFT_14658 [Teratosphaeria nubilosa]